MALVHLCWHAKLSQYRRPSRSRRVERRASYSAQLWLSQRLKSLQAGAKAGDSRQPAAQSAVPTALPLQQLSARGLPSARLPASNHATTPTTATLGAAEPGKVSMEAKAVSCQQPVGYQGNPTGLIRVLRQLMAGLLQVQGMRTFEMTGFHTRRCEFEHEYDNDCEVLISDLEILNTDSLVRHPSVRCSGLRTAFMLCRYSTI